MKIGVIYSVESYLSLEKPISAFSEVQFGISYIATVLKNAGHEVELLVLAESGDFEAVIGDFIKRFNPRMICFNAVTTRFPFMTQAARVVKETDASIYNAIGGAYAIISPETILATKYFDAVCTGEGEEAVISLSRMLEQGVKPTQIPNLWFFNNETGEIEKNANGSFISELDKLPFIDRELWNKWILNHTVHSLLIGRGCPFKCTYCSNHILAKSSDGKYVRFRSPENIIGEIKDIAEKYPALQEVYFEVETFGANINYAMALCEALYEFNRTLKTPLVFGINLAVTKKISANKALLQAMKKANFGYVNIGLESGSPRVRKEILKRPVYENEDLIHFANTAREMGIKVNLFILMGIPTETLPEFRETMECARACNPSECHISIFFPYPGTELHQLALQLGLLGKNDISFQAERKVACLDLPGFSKRRIRYEYIMAKYRIYKGRIPYVSLYAIVMRNFISGFPFLDHLLRYFLHQNPIGKILRRKVILK